MPEAAETLTVAGARAPERVIVPPVALAKVAWSPLANVVEPLPSDQLEVVVSQTPLPATSQETFRTARGVSENVSTPAVASAPELSVSDQRT